MKTFALASVLLLIASACSLSSCSGAGSKGDILDQAEQAYDNGDYGHAQSLCDSIVASGRADGLSVAKLCRLSLLFMRLSEHHTDNLDINTAMAAQAFILAADRDADSTMLLLNAMPVEDQARMAIITAINEARFAPQIGDSAFVDSLIFDY